MQQHDGGRGTCAIGLPQIALERKRTGKRTFDFDDDRRRFSRKACGRISEKECGGKGSDFGEVRQWPPFCLALQMPNNFRAFAFSTFGLISSRISSFAKSDSQRSGVITGQSEPNSILSCKMLLM